MLSVMIVIGRMLVGTGVLEHGSPAPQPGSCPGAVSDVARSIHREMWH